MTRLMPSRRSRQLLSLGLGTVVTVVMLSWALRDVAWPRVLIALSQAQWQWLVLGWVTYLLCYFVRAARWGRLLQTTVDPGRFRDRLAATFIGFGVSSVLPAYLGELARVMVLHRQAQVPRSTAIGSIFAERLLDVGVVFGLWMLPLLLGSLPNISAGIAWLPVGCVVMLAWGMLLLGACFPTTIVQGVAHLLKGVGLGRWQAPVCASLTDFLAGLQVLRQPRQTLLALGETLLGWGLNGMTYWSCLIAFGIISPGPMGALFTQSTVALAIALPATPGYVGPFEAAIRFALGMYGIAQPLILAYAIVLRLIMYVSIPLIAWAIAAQLGFSRQDLRREAQKTSIPESTIPF